MKPTWLYVSGLTPDLLPQAPLVLGEPTHCIDTRRKDRTHVKWVSKKERIATPPNSACGCFR